MTKEEKEKIETLERYLISIMTFLTMHHHPKVASCKYCGVYEFDPQTPHFCEDLSKWAEKVK